ncbi:MULTISPECIES: ankyrin repeat domain-containing protein [unclassified Kosakonia]|uniref:ankyrin repeat domain-containing protein n=1 Tax=unclassified Kosakonia TaxID=2632876 RepID=UPI0028A68EBD|nr:ankyrin repeat domain-containing protein [Kosakonia sp.]
MESLKVGFSIKKLTSVMLFSFLLVLLSACNDMKKIDPEKHFAGQQLVLAKAIQAADRESVLRLAKETDLNTPGTEDLTLLFFAINESLYNDNPPERLVIVSDLVRAGADPLQPQPRMPGCPAEVAAKGDKDIWLKALLDGGLDPNASDKIYHEPLIFSTLESKTTAPLALIIERGADINTKNSLGETPLVEAFFSADFDKMFFLLDHGADPNPVNNKGRSFRQMVDRDLQKVKKGSDYYNNLMKLDAKMRSLGE